MIISFIISFIFFSVIPYFISELLLYTFEPGRIFSKYGNYVAKIKNEFWHNSLGGCAVCFTQRISEILYLCYINLFIEHYGNWITYKTPIVIAIILNIILFIGFASIPYFIRGKWNRKKPIDYSKLNIDEQ